MYKERERRMQLDAIIFDLDSTLTTIEGIDELAKWNNTGHLVEPLTTMAMNGELSFEEVFERRLDIIRPTKSDLDLLGDLYCNTVTPGAMELIKTLQKRNTQIFVVSGGYNPAVGRVTDYLGICSTHVFANELLFSNTGEYIGINREIPLWKTQGKHEVIQYILSQNRGRFAFVGDSAGDMEAGKLTEQSICFAGIVAREQAMTTADVVVSDANMMALLPYL